MFSRLAQPAFSPISQEENAHYGLQPGALVLASGQTRLDHKWTPHTAEPLVFGMRPLGATSKQGQEQLGQSGQP